MHDDDLDSLLGSVDGENSYVSARNEEILASQKLARKSDRHLSSDGENGISARNELIGSYIDLPAVARFQKGYVEELDEHRICSQKINDILNDLSHPEDVLEALKKYRYNYSRHIENIEKTYNQFVSTQNITALARKAKQDFPLFFQNDDYSQNRIDFLVLKELFLRLREFNSIIKYQWAELSGKVSLVSLVNGGKAVHNLCNEQIENAQTLCRHTETFLHFIAAIIDLPDNDYNVIDSEIGQKAIYKDSQNYSYDAIFSGKKADSIASEKVISKNPQNIEKDGIPDVEINKSPAPEQKNQKPVIIEHEVEYKDVADLEEISGGFVFQTRGTANWNTREPYVIRLVAQKLKKEIEDLAVSIYFTETIVDKMTINGIIKRAMLRYTRSGISDIPGRYEEFVFKYLFQKLDRFTELFNLDEATKGYFLFHFGPLNMFRLVNEDFRIAGLGICWKYLEGNRTSRFVPEEYIRLLVLRWFEINVNSLDLQWDRIQNYNEIKRYISHIYDSDYRLAMNKIDSAVRHYYLKTGKSIDPNALFKKKKLELFSNDKIFVYKRFVDHCQL